ncbi:MAG: helix-turn-helix domain-containing protein [Lapillicoccus sp.]
MSESASPPRPYRSTLREEQAERTKLLIAHAARTRFIESGWAGTSVRSVAEAAGVSEATVYAVYGTKAGLAVSLVDTADADADVARLVADLRRADGDPRSQIAAYVAFERRLFEHGGDALRVIVEGQRNEPALAAAYVEGRGRGESSRREVFSSWPASTRRRGVTVQRGLDLFAMVSSIQAYDIATHERGWTPDEVQRWWTDTLVREILA